MKMEILSYLFVFSVILLSCGLLLCFLIALALHKLCKHIQFQNKGAIVKGSLLVIKKKQSRKDIDFSLPVSYRTLMAQTPFLQSEKTYQTDEKVTTI